jgi:hypothetical protein
MIRVLLDSWSSSTIINKRFVKNLRIRKKGDVEWSTAAGRLYICLIEGKNSFKLDELDELKIIERNAPVTEQQFSHDYILRVSILTMV